MRARVLFGGLVAALMTGMLAVPMTPASAAPATVGTLWVSPNPVSPPNNSCAHPGSNSVQAAITAAAAGNTIKVCPGTYAEQLIVNKNLKLLGQGAPQPVITYPASPVASACNPSPVSGVSDYDLLDVCSGALTLSAMTFAGPNGGSDCTIDDMGIAVVGGGSLKATNVTVKDIRHAPLDGCQGGIGILIGRQSTGQVGTATLTSVSVSDYQKGGLVVSNAGSSAKVSASSISGPGPTDQIASNGVEVIDGAKLTMTNGSVSGNECNVVGSGSLPICGPDSETQTQSGGFLLIDPAVGTTIGGTQVSNNDIGIYNFVGPDGSAPDTHAVPVISGALLTNNRYEGIFFDSGNGTVKGSTIMGGNFGVQIATYNTQPSAPKGSVTTSTISGALTSAVSAVNDGVADPFVASLSVTSSDLSSGNAYGVQNADFPTIIKATNNWWGDPSGPSDWSFGSGTPGVSANVDFFPWATNSTRTSFAGCNASGANITDNSNVGNRILCGTAGNDFIQELGSANVLIIGNGGNDHLVGGSGNDYLIGGAGNDVLDGSAGASASMQGRGGTNNCLPSATNSRSDHC